MPNTTAARPKRKVEASTDIQILVAIEGWNWETGAMFMPPPLRRAGEPVSVWRQLIVQGTVLGPKSLRERRIECSFHPEASWNLGADQSRFAINKVGVVVRQKLHVIAWLAADTLPMVIQMLGSNAYRYISLSCPEWGRTGGDLISYTFERDFQQEDWPDVPGGQTDI